MDTEKKYSEIFNLLTQEEINFIKSNLSSTNPDIKNRINEIFINRGVFEQMLSPNSYFRSEENLIELSKEGPLEKAVAQMFLGRLLDNDGYWNIPDYRYPFLEIDQQNKTPTYNDLNLGKVNWFPCGNNEFTRLLNNNDKDNPVILFNSEKQLIELKINNSSIYFSFEEILAILQKCRELGMKKPDWIK